MCGVRDEKAQLLTTVVNLRLTLTLSAGTGRRPGPTRIEGAEGDHYGG